MIGALAAGLSAEAATILMIAAALSIIWFGLRRQWGRLLIVLAVIVLAAILLAPTPADADTGDDTPTELGQLIDRQYNWTHAGQRYSLTMQLDADAYADARNISRGTTTLSSYAGYLAPDDPAVRGLADSISALGGDPALMALSFVRSLDYRTDMAAYGVEEYPAYPIETLVNGYGDCEDLAILYVSVMQALGRDAALLAMLDTPVGGHMAAGIAGPYSGEYVTHNGTAYYYAETTANMDIGFVPGSLAWDPETAHVLGATTVTASAPTILGAPGTTHIWDGGGANDRASTAANWHNNQAPGANAVVIYDGRTSKSCTWDISDQVYSLTIESSYTGTITQDSVDFIIGEGGYRQYGGYVVHNPDWRTKCSGSFISPGSYGERFQEFRLNLEMYGQGDLNANAALLGLRIYGDVTLTDDLAVRPDRYVTWYAVQVYEGATLTIPAGITYTARAYNHGPIYNAGTITGGGTLRVEAWHTTVNIVFGGDIDCDVWLTARSGSGVTRSFAVVNDIAYLGHLRIAAQTPAETVGLDLYHGHLYAKEIHLGTNARLMGNNPGATYYYYCDSIMVDPTASVASDLYRGLQYTTEPSVANIVTTIDGRTITASVVADNYTSIVWDMGDGTIYEGSTQVRHTYLDNGTYAINVTVSNWHGQQVSTSTAVQIGENETASASIDLPWIIFAIAAVVTGLLFILTRDPRALIGVVLAGAAMIALVVL